MSPEILDTLPYVFREHYLRTGEGNWYGGMHADVMDAINCVLAGQMEWPSYLSKWHIPESSDIRGLITCKSAINERRQDLKYLIDLPRYRWPNEQEQYRLLKSEQIIPWLIKNVRGEWWHEDFAGTVRYFFTNKNDAMFFKLAWGGVVLS
jgi:hypothetical protein